MKTSKYEEQVIRLLRAAGVKFIREKTFSDLKGGRFRFDFYRNRGDLFWELYLII